MFSAPTAIRVLKKFPTAEIRKHDLSSLEVLYLAENRWMSRLPVG